MATIKLIHADSDPFVSALDGKTSGREAAAKVSPEEMAGISVRRFFGSEEGELEFFAVRLVPNHTLAAHAHRDSEVMYVAEGELISGNRSYPPGSALHIPGNTLYSVRSGPDGLTFLNFRAKADKTYLTKEEFMAERAAQKANE